MCRCSGCELLVQNLEEQVLKANMRRDKQIQQNKDIEQEVMTASLLLCIYLYYYVGSMDYTYCPQW